MNYTYEQVLSLASDAATAKKVANKSKWNKHGANEPSVWGEYKGSGKKPYFTAIDLNEPAFKCSCPSRKFPCKHSIGLFLLYATDPEYFTDKVPPEWVQAWLDKRNQKTAKKTKDQSPEQKAKSDADKAKRQEKRLKTMTAGLEELEQWLLDIVRQGLGNLRTDDFEFWENQRRRMNDAQLKGLGNMLDDIRALLPKDNWMELVLAKLSEMYLIIQAFHQREHLSAELQADLFTWLGVASKKEDIQEQQGVKDTWAVLSISESQEELFTTRKTWMWGQKVARYALLLDFYRDTPQHTLASGMAYTTEVVYYPSASPMRALLKAMPQGHEQLNMPEGLNSFQQFLDKYAREFQKNPFPWNYPCLIHQVRTVEANDVFFLVDQNNIKIH